MAKTIKQLEAEVQALLAEVQELKAQVNPKPKVWHPRNGDTVYFVYADGAPVVGKGVYNPECKFNEFKVRHTLGEIFPTEKEAQAHIDKRLAEMRIIRKLREIEEGGRKDHYISCQVEVKKYHIICPLDTPPWKELLSTKAACQWVIDNMQDDLNSLFGVKENGKDN